MDRVTFKPVVTLISAIDAKVPTVMPCKNTKGTTMQLYLTCYGFNIPQWSVNSSHKQLYRFTKGLTQKL